MATNTNILLVEGRDDLHVVAQLLKHHLGLEKVEDVILIENKESLSKLLTSLRNDLQRSDLERVGIIVDADDDLAARWMSLRDRLNSLDDIAMQAPDTPQPEGTILEAERLDRMVKVGIWLMPDNTLPGDLEKFVSFLIPTNDTLWTRAQTVISEIPQPDRRFGINQSKAEIHTWLAWQKEPGRPLGLAIRARYLDPDAPKAQHFVTWLRQLFEL
ncbi:MAG: hypothetical protein KDJ65_22905 [Anaerolineae bacterium]|nr:hypothetical protein [Anaerolineae bacterium]